MRGNEFENDEVYDSKLGIKSGSEHVSHLFDSQIRN